MFTLLRSDYDSAYQNAEKILSDKNYRTECIVCVNDLMTMGIMKKAREMGIKVPEDLKVVGYDNLIYARSSDQSITTVNANAQLVGHQAGKYVMNETKELQCIKEFFYFQAFLWLPGHG